MLYILEEGRVTPNYSYYQPLDLGTWWPEIVCLLPVVLSSWERTELFLAAVASPALRTCRAAVPAWSLMSSVQYPGSAPAVVAKQVWLPFSVSDNDRGILTTLELWHGLGWVSCCTAFLHSCPSSQPESLAFLTNLWDAQRLPINSCNVFCYLSDTIIYKESSNPVFSLLRVYP